MDKFSQQIEIDFERGHRLEERLSKSGFNAMVPISIKVDEQIVAHLVTTEYVDVFIWPFLSSYLNGIEKLESGKSANIGLELADIRTESDGENVELYLYDHSSEQDGDHYTVSLRAFAAEVIVTAEEFIKYFLDVCQEYTEEDVQPYREYIADAREWYEQKYDEQV